MALCAEVLVPASPVVLGTQIVYALRRTDAAATTLSLETVQPDTLSTVLESYFEFLQGSGGK